MKLLTEGDRTCEECRGAGVAITATDPCTDYVECPHCENGRITERQNPTKPIDLAWWNEFARSVILAEQFRGAIARRGCEGRGLLSQRHLLGPGPGGTVEMRTILTSGPVIALPCYAQNSQTTLALLQLGLAHPDNLHPDAKTVLAFQEEA